MKTYTLHTPGYKKMPMWARKAFIDDNGQVFLPAVMMFGNEMTVFLMMGWEGIEAVNYKGHLYAPADWMIRETKEPEVKAIIEKSANRVRDKAREDND
jgi:hypothetical protein